MTRKAPSPAPSIEERLVELEAKVQFLMTSNTFNQTETVKEMEDLRRVVVGKPAREWLSVEEAANLCGYSVHSVRGWCKQHRIGVLDKRVWRINRELLVQFYVDRFGKDRLPAGLREG